MRSVLTRTAVAIAGGLALLAVPAISLADAPEDALARGARYIATTQQADGGFGGFGDGQTFDAIFALRSAGIDPAQVHKDGKSPADFLEGRAIEQTTAAGAAKAALAARATNLDPRSVGGVDLLAVVEGSYDPATGRYAADDFSQGVAMLGLACNGVDVPNSALLALRSAQLEDGGWGFDGMSDADTTAVVLQALVSAGLTVLDPATSAALAYLESIQVADGGWGLTPLESNTSSTAYVVQALVAAGIDPRGPRFGQPASPVDYLLGQQAGDGSFAGFDPAFATNQVLPALAGRSFCSAPVTPASGGIPAAPATRPTAPLPPNTGAGLDVSATVPLEVLVAVALISAGALLGFARKRH